MSKKTDRIVYKRPDGVWVNKKIKGTKASSTHKTQSDAANTAKGMLQNSGGGELIIKGLDGKIRSKDTIKPGNDPYPPKDTEH